MKSLHVCSVSWLLYALLERVYSSRFISQDAEYSLRARTALVSANASTMLPDKLPAGHCFKSRLGNTLLSREGSPSDGKTKENSSSARTFRQSAVLIPAFCWSNHTVTLMEQHGRLSGRYQQEGQTKGIRYHASFVHMNDILVMTIPSNGDILQVTNENNSAEVSTIEEHLVGDRNFRPAMKAKLASFGIFGAVKRSCLYESNQPEVHL